MLQLWLNVISIELKAFPLNIYDKVIKEPAMGHLTSNYQWNMTPILHTGQDITLTCWHPW
jgi:hypothetical protein